MADTEDQRDDSTMVAVVYKDQIKGGAVAEGINPGLVTLGWLRLGKNAENWVEVDPDTGKKVTAAQLAKAATATQEV